jgi:tetratricopeptide (TPR) repeat protein
MAAVYLFYLWNWTAAEKESKKTIELNPNFAEAYHLYAYLLLALGRNDEAVEAQRKSQELDPFARPGSLGYVLSCAGRYAEAEDEYRLKAEALPREPDLHYRLAELYRVQGREKESMNEFSETLRLEGAKELAAQVQAAYARNGNHGVQQWRLEHIEHLVVAWRSPDVKKMAQKTYMAPTQMAFAYARLGQNNEAMRWLEKAYETHDPGLIRLHCESDLNGLHHDARYLALVKQMGLPTPIN